MKYRRFTLMCTCISFGWTLKRVNEQPKVFCCTPTCVLTTFDACACTNTFRCCTRSPMVRPSSQQGSANIKCLQVRKQHSIAAGCSVIAAGLGVRGPTGLLRLMISQAQAVASARPMCRKNVQPEPGGFQPSAGGGCVSSMLAAGVVCWVGKRCGVNCSR